MTPVAKKGRFTGPIVTIYNPDSSAALGYDVWNIGREYRYYIAGTNEQSWISVEYGFLTDGASVPKFFQNLVSPWGRWGQAAGGHDVLCESLLIMQNGVLTPITRKQADDLLHEMMITSGVPIDTADTIYAAVRAYALVSGVSKPSSTAAKRALESAWVVANPEPQYVSASQF